MKINLQGANTAHIMLLLTAFIWGTGFIATEYALQYEIPVSVIMSVRFSVSAVVMFFFTVKSFKTARKQDYLHGVVAGVILFLAFYLQTVGQSGTNVSNSAFITSANVVMVPFIVWIFTKERPPIKIFVLSVVTLLGIGILTLDFSGGSAIKLGDILVFFCAIFFALHIAYLGTFAKKIEALFLTFMQLSTAAVLSLITMFFGTEYKAVNLVSFEIIPMLYLALFSTLICYTLQTFAQKHTTAGKAGIILSTESFFGSLISVMVGFELLTPRLLLGGIIIFFSVIMTQNNLLPLKKK